jgi:hypothetical protein
MSAKIQEDSRTLREFYPDPTLRHGVHCAFAHRFVPQYVQQNPYAFFSYLYRRDSPGGPMDPTRFIHSRWSAIFEPEAGLTAEEDQDPLGARVVLRRVTDLSMSVQELGARASALIEMPTPEQPPEAHFVCVVLLAPASDAGIWPRDVQARVFTLEESSERPESKTGLVCEWTSEGTHRNYGVGIPVNREAFLRAVTAVLLAQDAPTPADTKKPWWRIW